MTSANTKLVFTVTLSVLLNGCAPVSPNYAPVTTSFPDIPKDEPKYHLVKKGDTLYAISLLFDLDYRKLAQWNRIAPPYTIEIGQKIRLSDPNAENKDAETVADDSMEGEGTTPRMEEVEQRTERLPRTMHGAIADDSMEGGGTTPRKEEVEQRTERLPRATHGTVADDSMEGGGRAMHGAIAETHQKAATATNRISSQKKTAIPLNNTPNLTYRPSYKTLPIETPPEKHRSGSQKKSIISIDNNNMLKLSFQWPIKGKVLKTFSPADNKGIDIAGKPGQDVSAAETGKVVYSGQGLIGYGNLLIIKHNDMYLSAYANNSRLLVAEGSTVEKGEVIAKVGQAGSNKTSLHFEIRKNGKPVNPLNFLPGK